MRPYFKAAIVWAVVMSTTYVPTMAHIPKRTLIMLDVDNTLYEEGEVGIESQIVGKTHTYCEEVLDLSADQADELYRKYGSTVEGLKEEIWKDLSEEKLKSKLDAFYRQVYKGIDMSKLLSVDLPGESSTGYSHAKDQKLLRRLLSACPFPICLASNSPSWHVEKVVEVMGLTKPLCRAHRFTPDQHSSFPTKNTPQTFFSTSSSTDLQFHNYDNLLLFDDSCHNLERVCGTFSNAEGIHISSENSLADALLIAFGLVDPAFEFNQVKYLQSKNLVDRKAMDSETWNKVIHEIEEIQGREKGPIRIVDVGAGLLSMLDLFLHGDEELNFKPLANCRIDYVAYESNRALYERCHELLLSWGFSLKQTVSADEFIYYKKDVELRFILKDFSSSKARPEPPHLIVGCCFADLLHPNQLVPSLIRTFRLLETDNTLLYFPITFCGTTQFLPPLPFHTNDKSPSIPSDTLAFRLYSKALTETLGHNLNPLLLQQTMENFGMSLIAKSSADWKINPEESPYLFDTMMYFFGTAGGPQLMEEGWDATGWISRSKQRRPKIQVSNVDLLFRTGKITPETEQAQHSQNSIEEILFTDPGKVSTSEKPIPELGPSQVLSTS
jgi:phosphoglycolate phosphatase-like HAD superfamily hydrolase